MIAATPPARILVVDEPRLMDILSPSLSAAGYEVTQVKAGAEALGLMAGRCFDAMLLDLDLPDMDGKQVITRVREWSQTPIIVVSARDVEEEKIEALDRGAEDFVQKPFSVAELMARLRAALRRRDRQAMSALSFRAGDVCIDFGGHRATVEGEEIHFSPREYLLLQAMAHRPGEVMTHKQIVAAVWGADGHADAQSVRVLVSNIRQKIEKVPSSARILVTEPGLGYRLVPSS